jgi:hypothetical protein
MLGTEIALLSEEPRVELVFETSLEEDQEKIGRLYEWNQGNWRYTNEDLESLFGMTHYALLKFAQQHSRIRWRKGPCANAGTSARATAPAANANAGATATARDCEGEVILEVRTRAILKGILKEKLDFREDQEQLQKLFPAITARVNALRLVYFQPQYHASVDGNLCNTCLEAKLAAECDRAEQADKEAVEQVARQERIKQERTTQLLGEIAGEMPSGDYIPTGFKCLDQKLGGGWKKNALHILAGPAGEAQSCLLTTVAGLNQEGVNGVWFSYSGSPEEVKRQLLARELGIDEHQLEHPESLSLEDLESFRQALEKSLHHAVDIINPMRRSMQDLEAAIEEYIAKGKTVFLLDPLQSIAIHPQDRPYAANREQEVSAIILRLADIVRTRKVTLILRCLMNREIEKLNTDRVRFNGRLDKLLLKWPSTTDLRDSHLIADYAHSVTFLHRPSFYFPEEPEEASEASFVVAKNGYRTHLGACAIHYIRSTGFFTD